MKPDAQTLDDLAKRVMAAPRAGQRRVVAIVGPPASGKSTLAEALAQTLSSKGCAAQVVGMDGFHLDNQTLVDRAMLNRKGAPETFDAAGFVALVRQLRDAPEISFPTFDRMRDISIQNGGRIASDCDTVIVEGNYLLFDAPVWRDLRGEWDYAIALKPSMETLRKRLVDRWLDFGMSEKAAIARAEGNDLANAQTIADASLPADFTI